MDFQRFFDAFEAQARNVAVLTQKVDDLRLSNLQLLQAVRRAERLPRVLDPESKRQAARLREQALAQEREQLRQQRARRLQRIEREMASKAGPPPVDLGALTRARRAPEAAAHGASTSLSTEDELNSTVIAKDRLDLFRQVASGGRRQVASSLLDQVNLESPSTAANGHEESLAEFPEDGPVPQLEDVSVYGANTTTGTGFYTTSTDILQYMRHSTNTITSMFTLQEEEEEELASRRQTPAPAAERPNPQPRAVNGERQHLTRYLLEASLPDEETEAVDAAGPELGGQAGGPWGALLESGLGAQEELGLQLQAEIRAQEARLRAQMELLTCMRNNSAASPPPRLTPRPLTRSSDPAPSSPPAPRLPRAEELPPGLRSKFCRVSAAAKGFLTRRLYRSDRAQAILKTVKDTAECALSLSEAGESGGPSRRQDAFLHSRLVNQLQASLYDFHDLFFASTPAQRMAVIRATRQARQAREREQEEAEEQREEPDEPRKPPRLSAATLRRMALREKGQLHNVVQPRFVKKPHEAAGAAEDSPRPATAPPRAQLRVLRPLNPHPQPQPHPHPQCPAPKPRAADLQRARSLRATGKAPTAPAARPATAPPAARSQGAPRRRQTRPVHVMTLQDAGRRVTRKVRGAAAEEP